MGAISDIFTIILLNPMINFLVILNNVLFSSFGLAIIAFTIIIRLVTFPATLRQLHSTRAMQSIQPRIQEINKKFSDPKRRQQEVMGVYKDAGVNPLGCLGPMVLQFPILIALYSAVRLALATSPEALERLSGHMYSWSYLQHAVPLQDHFIGMDLRTGNLIMVVLVGVTTWAQTKTTVSNAVMDDKQRAQQQMMAYMMPLMFAFFALNFPAGVSLYWVVNSIVGIVFNIAVYGLHIPPWVQIEPMLKPKAKAGLVPSAAGLSTSSPAAALQPAQELRTVNGSGRSKRQNRRRRP
ncbi:MAG: YidC/Oxa1 family membrane protein insertase [Tepidiformaceae bacterium]